MITQKNEYRGFLHPPFPLVSLAREQNPWELQFCIQTKNQINHQEEIVLQHLFEYGRATEQTIFRGEYCLLGGCPQMVV